MPLIKIFISYHTQAAAHIQSVFEISIIRHSSSPHTSQTPITCVSVPTYCKTKPSHSFTKLLPNIVLEGCPLPTCHIAGTIEHRCSTYAHL